MLPLTLTYKSLSGLYCGNSTVQEANLWEENFDRSCRCASSSCARDSTFDLTVLTLTSNNFFELYLDNHKDLVVMTMSFTILSWLFPDYIRCRRLTLHRDTG